MVGGSCVILLGGRSSEVTSLQFLGYFPYFEKNRMLMISLCCLCVSVYISHFIPSALLGL
jgi:hypothetical protein